MEKPNPCLDCPTPCCGQHPDIGAPILLPREVEEFEGQCHKVSPLHSRLDRGENGLCVFHNGKFCMMYHHRPLECRLYPYIMRWNGKRMVLKLDSRCPHRYKFPTPTQALPSQPEWCKGFERLPD